MDPVALDLKRVEAKIGNLICQITGYEQVIEGLTQQLAQALAENATLKQRAETGEVRPFPHAAETG